jgi:putative PIN family toxin of toxin-antitoxin system
MSNLRFVLDTNVIVSAALVRGSIPRLALNKALDLGKLLISAATVIELDDVLRRNRFDKYLTEEERLVFLAALVKEGELVDITDACTDCRDPKDNKFLELALSARATCIISGDADLLILHPFRGAIPVVTPQVFLTMAW